MRKRWIGICSLFLLITALLTVAAFASEPTLRIVAPQKLPAVGGDFEVVVNLSGNPGISSAQLTLVYDRDVLECTSVEVGDVLEGTASATNPDAETGAVIAAAASENITGNGPIAVFTFTVKSAKTVKLSLTDVILADENGEVLPFSADTATLTSPTMDGDEPATEPETDNEPAFTDISGHWAESYIVEAAELKLFNGYPDGTFGPEDLVTRAQFVTVLYRSAGSPVTIAAAPFTDIQNLSTEFRNAITWAYANGYVNGTSATTFEPDRALTRQEAMKILFCYNGGMSGMELAYTSIYDNAYQDSGSIAGWAKPAMYWGVYNKIIAGVGDNMLDPTGTATRAQLAKIMVNIHNMNQ